MKKIYYGLLTFAQLIYLLCFFNPIASANDFAGKWYQVELIIFSHITANNLNAEKWPIIVPRDFNRSNIVQLLAKNQTDYVKQHFRLLTNNAFQLKREQEKLNRKPGYHVLLHLVWQQLINNRRLSKSIHLFGGNTYNQAGKIMPSSDSQFANRNFSLKRQVDGTITISVNKYFNVDLNLYFAAPLAQLVRLSRTNYFQDVHKGLAYFHLLQSRRMRSNELNYFDYPLYGALIKITHIKQT